MVTSFILVACLLTISLLGIDALDNNSIATKTLLMQPECHGNCKGYDACVIYDIDDDNPCDGADDSKDSDFSSQKSSKCQKTDKDSDYQYQCLKLLSDSAEDFSVVVTTDISCDKLSEDIPQLESKFLYAVDLRLNDSAKDL